MGDMYPFYNERTEAARRDWIQQGREIRKAIEERKEDPYKGNVIKVGTYHYGLPNKDLQAKEQSYEDKVNALLTEFNGQIQNGADAIIADQQEKAKMAKQLLSNPQNSVDSFVTQQNYRNTANQIVSQNSAQTLASKVMNDRDDGR